MALGALQRTVGANLAVWRRERGLSQEAFADALGYHRTYIGGLERGERNLSLQAVERLAEQLDLNPLELLTPPPAQTVRR
jgi:transcriptional regulator with XRE-family HTH domain